MNDFDLSVGSMASLSGVIAALLFTMDYPVWLAAQLLYLRELLEAYLMEY